MILKDRAFENVEGNEKNAGNLHFLLFPQSFLHAISLGSLKLVTVQ